MMRILSFKKRKFVRTVGAGEPLALHSSWRSLPGARVWLEGTTVNTGTSLYTKVSSGSSKSSARIAAGRWV